MITNIPSAHKSEKARQQAFSSYDEVLSHWPVPFENRQIETQYGKTHVLISGLMNVKSLVLLHGAGSNSTMWVYNIAALAKYFKIFAIDIIGEAGKSAGTRPSLKTDDFSFWLKEILEACNLHKTAICGLSLGGTIAQQFYLKFPERVSELILIAPPSLFKLRLEFLWKTILANLFPTSTRINKFIDYLMQRGPELPEWSREAFVIQFQTYRPNWYNISLISDHDLKQLPAKTLIILGQNEVLYHSDQVVHRLEKIAPFIKVVVLSNAKHVVSIDQVEKVNEMIIEFLIP